MKKEQGKGTDREKKGRGKRKGDTIKEVSVKEAGEVVKLCDMARALFLSFYVVSRTCKVWCVQSV